MYVLLPAGRFVDAAFKTTADGFEQCYASNFYGHAYLTLLLLKRIMDSQPSRIVCVISFGELLGRLPWEDLNGQHLGTSGIRAYANSKLMFYTWMLELQMRLARTGKKVDVFGTQPGEAGSRKTLGSTVCIRQYTLRVHEGHCTASYTLWQLRLRHWS
jgi:NAD(P)-dependent dehydrogenase (short-subunit alcohol dehydrogenase family)